MSATNAATNEMRERARTWVVRLAEADPSPEDHAAFNTWLAAHPDHGEAYQRALRLYGGAGELKHAFASGAVHRTRRFSAPALGVGLAGAALAAAFALVVLTPREAAPLRPDHATQVAEVREIRLDDGSIVTLGAATTLEVVFSTSERRVRISDGEAYFQVAHSQNRPFLVEAHGTIVRVVGTEFEVKSTPDLVRVGVSSGVVDVNEPTRIARLLAQRTHRLTAGEEVVITRQPFQPIAVVAAPRPPASWRDGFLVYDGASLAEVVADANRYSRAPIELSDQRLAGLRVTASYPVEQLDQMLASLDAGLPIDIERAADGGVRLVPAPRE